MRYLSVCSGIEAATVAWHPLGWEAAAYSEIEKFPSQVLAHHYPNTPNVGDMTKFKEWPDATINVLVGGTPCQSFSVAGLRKGLDDPRGNLMLTYLAIAAKYRPKWLVWENVPGVLSSNGGRDFGTFLAGLGELGYGFAYRVLDASYFGVAQRRRRVFVVGCLGDWRSAAAVLFERQSLRGDTAPSREARKDVAKCLTRGVGQRYDPETESLIPIGFNCDAQADQLPAAGKDTSISESLTRSQHSAVEKAQNGRGWNDDGTAYTVDTHATQGVAVAQPIAIQGTLIGRGDNAGPQGSGVDERGSMFTLTKTDVHAVAQPMALGTDCYNGAITGEVAATIGTPGSSVNASGVTAVHSVTMQVRHLTPVECERLQGFPDNYTNIPWRKADQSPDGPRYKALGNSMAVPVMAWIGKRIQEVEAINAP